MAMTSDCDWDSCLSAVNLGDKTLFICSECVTGKIGATQQTVGDADLRARFPQGTCFALTAHNPGDKQQSSVRNALANAALERDLVSCKPSEAHVLNSFALAPTSSGTPPRFERGFFITSSCHQSSAAEKVVADAAKKYGQASYFRYVRKEGGDVIQQWVETMSGRVIASSRLVSVAAPQCPPMFGDPSYNSVFRGREKIGDVLKELQTLQPDAFSPDFWSLSSSILDEASTLPMKADHPVVVIEGLDGTGKSTLCENLSRAIPNATLMATPPKKLLQFRTSFDGYPPLVRRAYYSLGNYIAAQEIVLASKTGPVIVDRYWHSSAAYAIASEVECGGKDSLPPLGHEVYRWPPDLLKPDLVVVLVVSPEVRLKRMNVRGGVKTEEEMWLERSQKFQERLLGSYERMESPSPHRVDANGTKEEVLAAVLKVIQDKLSTVSP